MEALSNIGIDGKLLLAQVVNFGVLLFILRRYAYQPMLNMMDERTSKIERGLQDAESAQTKLREMEEKEKTVLSEARAEAKRMLAETELAGKKRDALKIAETEDRVKKLLADAEAKIIQDRSRMLADAKGELAETVMLAVEKILKEKGEK